jgi:hypothetical protein
MLADYDQFVAAVNQHGEVAVGAVVGNRPLSLVCSSATDRDILPFFPPPPASSSLSNTGPGPAAASSGPSASLTNVPPSVASASFPKLLLFVLSNFHDVCLVGRLGVGELAVVAEGAPWAVRIGLLFGAIRHSSSAAAGSSTCTVRLATDVQSGLPLLSIDVSSPLVMRFLIPLTSLVGSEAAKQRDACVSFAMLSVARSHIVLSDQLEKERRRRLAVEEELERARQACAAAGIATTQLHASGPAAGGSGGQRGKLLKPQSLLHPGQSIGVKRARGVKIE